MTRCVLMADDTPDMLFLMRVAFNAADIQIVGEATNGDDALRMWHDAVASGKACVVVLDQFMPGLTGLEVAKQILAEAPETVVVLFSAHLDADLRETAELMGVAACVSKSNILTLPSHPAFN